MVYGSKFEVSDIDEWGRRYKTIISIKGKNGNVEDVIVGWILDGYLTLKNPLYIMGTNQGLLRHI